MVYDLISKSNILKLYLVIPPKFYKEFILLYHKKSGHKGINNLGQLISHEGFYIKGIYKIINEVIKDCIICNQNKKIYL